MILKDLDAVRALLREKRLPVTDQRLAVYRHLAASRAHPSAETIFKALKPKHPSLSLATVYKTLQAFHERGIISLVNAPHTEARYDVVTGTHHHLICKKCGAISDVFDEKLDRLRPTTPDFEVQEHSVHFYGYCNACRIRRKNNV
jgi:Fur family peroxide stress response transcriptional regulator